MSDGQESPKEVEGEEKPEGAEGEPEEKAEGEDEAGGEDGGEDDEAGEDDGDKEDGEAHNEDGLLDDEEDAEEEDTSVVVPRFDDLIVKTLADNYDIYPALDRIPPEYLDNVVALLDPGQIEFIAAAKYINAEKFWKRLAQERWPICQLAHHGLSWKRLYIERHIQSLFEAYYPSTQGQNFERLIKEVTAGKNYVHTITIQQLLSHLDLSDILIDFPNLSSLTLKYGARKLGMDFDKSLFGMQLKDTMNIAKFLSKTRTLSRLVLTENLLNDESIHILASGLNKNDTLTYLDLSHNKIADNGAKRLARLVRAHSVLTHLDLSDNRIHEAGARAIGAALRDNDVLQHLSLKLNPMGDAGAGAVMEQLTTNQALSSLNLAGQGLTSASASTLNNLLREQEALTSINVSSNDIQLNDETLAALQSNRSLIDFDLRRNPVEDETLTKIKALMTKRSAAAKQVRRQAYQNGWDMVH